MSVDVTVIKLIALVILVAFGVVLLIRAERMDRVKAFFNSYETKLIEENLKRVSMDFEEVNTVIDLGTYHPMKLNEYRDMEQWRVMLTSPYKMEVKQIGDALDKYIPKKPTDYSKVFGKHCVSFECPTCKMTWGRVDSTKVKFCANCGQAIDWEEL